MIDLTTATSLPIQESATIDDTGDLLEIRFDSKVAKLSIRFIDADGKLCFDQDLDEGDPIGAAEYSTVSQDEWTEVAVRRDRRTGTTALTKVFVTSDAGVRVEVIGEGSV